MQSIEQVPNAVPVSSLTRPQPVHGHPGGPCRRQRFSSPDRAATMFERPARSPVSGAHNSFSRRRLLTPQTQSDFSNML
jgi:hypothetical protein